MKMQKPKRRKRPQRAAQQVATLLQRAVRAHRSGALQEAEAQYRKVLQLAPGNVDAIHLLGVSAHQAGQNRKAVHYIRQAIEIDNRNPDFHLHLGNAYQELGELDRASECYRQALERRPRFALAKNNWGNVLKAKGQRSEALRFYTEALADDANCSEARYNLISLHLDLGDLRRAGELLDRSLAIDPRNAYALSLQGTSQLIQGQTRAAVQSYKKALQIENRLPEAWSGLSSSLYAEGNVAAAREAIDQAIRRRPRRGLLAVRKATLCPIIPSSNDEIEACRARFAEELERLANELPPISRFELAGANCPFPFYFAYHGRNDRQLRSSYADLVASKLHADGRSCEGTARTSSSGKPHIVFVVTDRRESIFLRFMRGMIEALPANSLRATVVCSRSGKQTLEAGLASTSAEIVATPRHLTSMANAIEQLKADLLFHFEVGTDNTNYFLPLLQLAPRQCTSWAIPLTSGIAAMNYFISSSALEIPDAATAHYREQLVLLNQLPVVFRRPEKRVPQRDRADFQFQVQDRIYLCPHSLFKLHPDMDQLFQAILQRDGAGQVVLIQQRQEAITQQLKRRLRKTLGPDYQRIRFLPKVPHDTFLDLLRSADVLLDPIHFGGGSVTYEALAMDLPIVTWPSQFLRGRVTAGCYRQMGYHELIAANRESYADTAVRVASDPEWKHQVQADIHESKDVLFDNQEAAHELGQLFLRLTAR